VIRYVSVLGDSERKGTSSVVTVGPTTCRLADAGR